MVKLTFLLPRLLLAAFQPDHHTTHAGITARTARNQKQRRSGHARPPRRETTPESWQGNGLSQQGCPSRTKCYPGTECLHDPFHSAKPNKHITGAANATRGRTWITEKCTPQLHLGRPWQDPHSVRKGRNQQLQHVEESMQLQSAIHNPLCGTLQGHNTRWGLTNM